MSEPVIKVDKEPLKAARRELRFALSLNDAPYLTRGQMLRDRIKKLNAAIAKLEQEGA